MRPQLRHKAPPFPSRIALGYQNPTSSAPDCQARELYDAKLALDLPLAVEIFTVSKALSRSCAYNLQASLPRRLVRGSGGFKGCWQGYFDQQPLCKPGEKKTGFIVRLSSGPLDYHWHWTPVVIEMATTGRHCHWQWYSFGGHWTPLPLAVV